MNCHDKYLIHNLKTQNMKIRISKHSLLFCCIVLFHSSCTQDRKYLEEEFSFTYHIYEENKDLDLRLEISESIINLPERPYKYELINDQLNNKFGTDLNLTELDYAILQQETNKSEVKVLINHYLDDVDIALLEKFDHDLEYSNFENAINNFQSNVVNLNLSKGEFNRYNLFVNILLLLENADENVFASKNNLRAKGPCEEAITAYSLATIGLAACAATGPIAPIVCGAAIAAKVLAFRAMARDCKT